MVTDNLRSVWRFARRLGVPEADVDDAVQEVILVAARRLDQIEPGRERAFMMATAYRVASDMRRARARRGEVAGEEADGVPDSTPSPEALLEQRKARALLDDVLDELPLELRAVFVLYELDGLTMAEIAVTLELAPGTVASRLRRARETFESHVARFERRSGKTGGAP